MSDTAIDSKQRDCIVAVKLYSGYYTVSLF